MANKYFRALAPIIALLLLNVTVVVAQGPPRPPGPGLPIDGGLAALFVLGAGYAVKKIHDHSKK
ncbi:MAG: hypothetical protein WBV45_13910 [Lutimonas sp.]